MEITGGARDSGIYAIQSTGRQIWTENDGTWQAPGVQVSVMNGRTPLARLKAECPPQDADGLAAAVVAGIEPWTGTLRYLSAVRDLRTSLSTVERLQREAEDAAAWMEEETAADIASELARHAAATGTAQTCEGAALARLVAARLRGQITTGLRRALAVAPDPAEHPLHPAWEQPGPAGLPWDNLAPSVARDLLTAWAHNRELRDPLITWAVTSARLTRTDVQQVSGVSRSTINRLLPDSASGARN